MKIPGPVPDESISLGTHRSEVEVALRAAPANEYSEAWGSTVIYKFKDGPPQASKARVVIYIAGDVLLLFLSELVFWPIEVYASNRTERIATAHYDTNNDLVGFNVNRKGGELLIALGEKPEGAAEPATPAVGAAPAGSGQASTQASRASEAESESVPAPDFTIEAKAVAADEAADAADLSQAATSRDEPELETPSSNSD